MTMLRNLGKSLGKGLIRFYQICISPWKPPSCRYYPTCSNYALHAVSVHGLFKGVLLATWRLMRCNPWTNGGVDQVPAKGRWKPQPYQELSEAQLTEMFRRIDNGEPANSPLGPVSPR